LAQDGKNVDTIIDDKINTLIPSDSWYSVPLIAAKHQLVFEPFVNKGFQFLTDL
jgi:hypothetical protein